MALTKEAAAQRTTELANELTVKLGRADGQGKRVKYEWMSDVYGTATVRLYAPEGVSPKALSGIQIDYSDSSQLAEPIQDLTRKRSIRARHVVSFDADGKPAAFEPIAADAMGETALIVVDVPDWATLDSLTITV